MRLVSLCSHTHIYVYLARKSTELYRSFHSQTGDVPWPLNTDILVLLLPSNIHCYLPIPPLVTRCLGLPFPRHFPDLPPLLSNYLLPLVLAHPHDEPKNTNTLEFTKPTLPPNMAAKFYSYKSKLKTCNVCTM